MRRIAVLVCLAASIAPAAVRGAEPVADEGSTTPIAPGLVQKDARTITGPRNFLHGYPAIVAGSTVNAVIEVPTGYVDKWEVKAEDGWLHWDLKDGKLVVVREGTVAK